MTFSTIPNAGRPIIACYAVAMRDILFRIRVSATLVVAFLVFHPARGHISGVEQTPAAAARDQAAYGRIRDEGLSRSKVMDYATQLIDGIGPRLTGSPNLKRAIDWAREQLTQMGLSQVRAESWGEFGVGWEQRNVWVRMVAPDTAVFIAQADPWSPATPGPVTGDVRFVGGLADEEAFAGLRGTLRDRIVLLARAPGPPDVGPIDKPLFSRFDEAKLAALARAPVGAVSDEAAEIRERTFAQVAHGERIGRFLAAEGVRAVIVPSGNRPSGGISGGTLIVDGNAAFGLRAYEKARQMQVPVVIVANEHYGRLERLLARNVPVRIEINVDAAFTGERVEGFNVLAEIPGVDPVRKDQIVMAGAHLDSWAAGTGATDDGAGVLIGMEAMRILRAIGLQPRRTIRLALWTGEEQGALGSLGYVNTHVATVPRATTDAAMAVPEFLRRRAGPITFKAGHAQISAIFTLDAGGGRIRGVSVGTPALAAIFEPWVASLRDLGMTMVSPNSDCGGDCRPFAEVGLPTPVFTHDPLDYETRTHHTNMDTYEHLIPDDLRQAAVVVATMLYNTAMREEMLPRPPQPH
jgi:carboxypeptidase Q